MAATWDREWIEGEENLTRVVEAALREPYIALDTETVGWETNDERLCLIQVGLPLQKKAFLIDALSINNYEHFADFLSIPKPLVIAHNAAFEERQFNRYKIKIKGICDTLSMARTLRPDLPNHTLQTCCRLLLGTNISKEEQISDWSIRPLSPEQLHYAALDVEVATALYEYFSEMEAKLTFDAQLSVETLMHLLAESVRDRFDLCRTIAPELALLNRRADMLRETIRAKLIDGESAYEGPYGKASVSKIKKTELNPKKVRTVFPELAPLVLVEAVDRKRLQSVMKEYGIDPNRIEEVSDIIGFTDRLNLSLKDFTS